MTSLRERKKAETRQRIADVATAMFVERGFDTVTVAEVAEAAGVSKVTVFNYFTRKEDIFFDRGPQAEELLTAAVRDRPAGTSPLRAFRGLLVDLAARQHPLGGFRERYCAFWRTILDSPALLARLREATEEMERLLTRLIAETADDPQPRLTAAVAIATFRTTYTAGVARMLAGARAEEVTADHIAALDHGFDILAGGLR